MLAPRPLTKLEQRILDDLAAGRVTDCRAADGSRGELAGQFIRDVLRGAVGDNLIPDPRGLRIAGANIRGCLDLAYVSTQIPLTLESCTSEDPIVATCAKLTSLSLDHCNWTTGENTAFDGMHLNVTHDLALDWLVANTTTATTIELSGATIGRILSLYKAKVSSTGRTAFCADQLTAQAIRCNRLEAQAATEGDAVSMVRATITSQASFIGAHLTSAKGAALTADGAAVAGAMYCNEHIEDSSTGQRLVTNFTAISKEGSAVRIDGASFGALYFCGAQLEAHNGPALFASNVKVLGDLFLNNRFRATSTHDATPNTTTRHDAVMLGDATINGQLNMHRADLSSETGAALRASGATVVGKMSCNGLHACSAAGPAVALLGADMRDQLSFTGARLESHAGMGLYAEHLTVKRGMFLDGSFNANDCGGESVRLVGATIGSQLVCRRPDDGQGPCVRSLNLQAASVDTLVLDREFGPRDKRWLRLDGLTTKQIPFGMSADQWIICLRHHAHESAMQPWRQLAQVYAAAGREQEARKILIAQQDNHRDKLRSQTTDNAREYVGQFVQRSLLAVSGWLTGYGYQSWRAAVGLVAVVIASIVFALGTDVRPANREASIYVAGQTVSTRVDATPCTRIERVALGLEIGLPLVKVPASDRCRLNTTSKTGQLATAASWVLQLLAWAFATLAVAGYTGLIRRL